MRIAVLGGGATGLTLAYRLTQAGQQVVVYEREAEPGGLASGTKINGTSIEKFYHHIFKTDTAITRVIHELGLGDRLLWLRPVTSNLLGGRPHALDSAISLLRFGPLPFVDRLRLGMCIAFLKATSNYHRFEHVTAAQWCRQWMGKRAFDTIVAPLLRSKFGVRAEDILMSWLWSRFHERTTYLGYMRFGFQALYDKLAAAVSERGGVLHFGTQVDSVERTTQGDFVVAAGERGGHYDRVVSTLPTRVTFRVVRGLPEAFRARYDYGEAFGAQCLIVTLDRQFGDVYWLSVNDPGYPFLVLVEHTNLVPPEDYGGAHILYLGNYLPMDDPRMRLSADEVMQSYIPAIQRINPAFQPEWITGSRLFVAPFAQPVVTQDFPAHIPPNRTPLPGFYMANMFQVYPQDRGQNYAIAMAERVARQVLADASLSPGSGTPDTSST